MTAKVDKMEQSECNNILRITGLEEDDEKHLSETNISYIKKRLEIDVEESDTAICVRMTQLSVSGSGRKVRTAGPSY